MDVLWLVRRLNSLHKTRMGLSRAIGVQPSAISRILKGSRRVQAREIAPMARYLEVPEEILLQKIESPSSPDDDRFVDDLDVMEQRWGALAKEKHKKKEEIWRQEHEAWSRNTASMAALSARRLENRELGVNSQVPVMGIAQTNDDGWMALSGKVIDRLRRPPALAFHNEGYAMYVPDNRMEPRYYEGEVIFLHTGKPVASGSFILLQRIPEKDHESVRAIICQFLDEKDGVITIRQLSPETITELEKNTVIGMHKIILSGEP